MEQRELYQTAEQLEMDCAPGWARILDEREVERHRCADTEMVLTYVPEADEMDFNDALKVARERDQAAAEALRLDFIQTATL